MPSRFFPFTLITNASATDTSPQALMRNAIPADAAATKPIEEMLADSFNSNNAVMAYVLGITGSRLPPLTPPPTWYKSFMVNFSDAQAHSMRWLDTIAPQLAAIPSAIIDFSTIFDLNYMNIAQVLPILERDPGNELARGVVIRALENLLTGLNTQLNAAVDLEKKLNDFSDTLKADSAMMQGAIDNAEKEVGYDREKVAQLVRDIESLKSEIKTWQTVITAAGIAGGIGIFTGCVIAIFTMGFGIAFGIASAIASITTILVGQAKIKELSYKIQQDEAVMDDLNRQIGDLQALQQQLRDLIVLAAAAGQQIQLILQAWSELEREIKLVITDLEAAEQDVYLGKVKELETQLALARSDWNQLVAFCRLIKNIRYADAQPPSAVLPMPATTEPPKSIAA